MIWVGEAARHLARARLRVAVRSTKQILTEIAAHAQASAAPRPAPPAVVSNTRWAIAAAARRVPWRADCLIQALATVSMLHRRRIDTTFRIGVRRSASGEIEAHAWVMVDDEIVCGGSAVDVSDYTTILDTSDAVDIARLLDGATPELGTFQTSRSLA